jgi:hypothetical protein
MAAQTFSSSALCSGAKSTPSTWRRKKGQTLGSGDREASSRIGIADRIVTCSPAPPAVCVSVVSSDAIGGSSLSSHPSR